MVRRRDVDRVEVLFLVEQFSPILVDFHVGETFLDLGGAIQIDFGDGDEFEVLAAGQRVDVGPGHAVGAEAGVINRFARCCQSMLAEHKGHCERRGHGTCQKASSIHLGVRIHCFISHKLGKSEIGARDVRCEKYQELRRSLRILRFACRQGV